jgi:hypothetical protein
MGPGIPTSNLPLRIVLTLLTLLHQDIPLWVPLILLEELIRHASTWFPSTTRGGGGRGVDSHPVGDHQLAGRAHQGVPGLEHKLEPPIPSLYHFYLLV